MKDRLKQPVNVLAEELASMLLHETQAYFRNTYQDKLTPERFMANVREAVCLYFLDYDFIVVRAKTLADLKERVKQSCEKKLRKELSIA